MTARLTARRLAAISERHPIKKSTNPFDKPICYTCTEVKQVPIPCDAALLVRDLRAAEREVERLREALQEQVRIAGASKALMKAAIKSEVALRGQLAEAAELLGWIRGRHHDQEVARLDFLARFTASPTELKEGTDG